MRTCVGESGKLDLGALERLRTSVTIDELFTLQDIAAVEGDMQWQMQEFRREDLRANPNGHARGSTRRADEPADDLTPGQHAARTKLLQPLSSITRERLHDVVALTRRAAKAGISYAEAAAANEVRARPTRVGRRPRTNGGEHGN